MSEAPAPEQLLREIDRTLLAESKLYNVPYGAYVEMTPRERARVKGSWAHRVRAEAKRRGLDPDEFLAMDEAGREDARKLHPERPRGHQVAKLRAAQAAAAAPSPEGLRASYVDEGLSSDMPDEEAFSMESSVPATEADPRLRQKPTIGPVEPIDNQDLVGRAPPKNLRDIYSLYLVGDGQHFIRVERIEPRVYQQIPCSGYLGEIREPISEDQFRQWYGGRVYSLTVYGPDPKGRTDTDGMPIIKAKTQPFRYTVPVFPPNLMLLPGMNPSRENFSHGATAHGEQAMNPFLYTGAHPGMPTTPADASAQKNTLEFIGDMIKRGDAMMHTKAGPDADVLKVVSDTSKSAIDAANKAAEAREQALRDQLADQRTAQRELENELRALRQQLTEQPKSNSLKDAAEFYEKVHPPQAMEAQIAALKAQHSEEINRMKETHKEAMALLKERQDDELKRIRERMDDAERQYKMRLEDAEKRGREREDEAMKRLHDRERELRDDIERVRREEREASDKRVKDVTDRFNERIQDLKSQQERELRMQTEQHETRSTTQKSTYELQLTSTKERLKKLEDELETAREEVEAAKDPVTVMENAKRQAEALGFEKPEEAGPKTAGERFAATAGMGLSKAFETIGEWGPEIARAIGQRQAQAPLGGPGMPQRGLGVPPPGQQPGAPRPRRQSPRAVAWATQNSIPITDQQPIEPPRPPEAAPPPAPPADPTAAQPVQQPAPVAPPPPPATSIPESQATAPPGTPPVSDNPLLQLFPPDAAEQFRARVEQAITAGMDAETFAASMMKQVPDGARLMITYARPEHLVDAVRAMPNSLESPILRRDGKRWVEDLWKHLIAAARAPSAAAS